MPRFLIWTDVKKHYNRIDAVLRACALLCCLSAASLLPVCASAAGFTVVLSQGLVLMDQGRLPEAASRLEHAVRLQPGDVFARSQLGLVYARQGRIEPAIEQFRHVKNAAPADTFARLWLGILYLGVEKLDEAAREFHEILAIDPRNADAHYFIGALHSFRRDSATAIASFHRALLSDSDDPDTYYRLAEAYRRSGMEANALLAYRRCRALDPGHLRAHCGEGWVHYNAARIDDAIKLWRAALVLNPASEEARFSLTRAYNDQALRCAAAGDTQQAASYWKKTLAIEPGNKAALYYLKKNFRGAGR